MSTVMREWNLPRFRVVATAHDDCDLDLSWDDTGETLRGLESGSLVSFGVRVRVYLDGAEVGEDSLWGCIDKSVESFMNHKEAAKETRQRRAAGKTGAVGSYFADMVRGAIADARENVRRMQSVHVREVQS